MRLKYQGWSILPHVLTHLWTKQKIVKVLASISKALKPRTRCTSKLWAVEFVNEYRSLISNATNISSIQALVKQRKLALDGQDKDTSVFKYISKLEKCILQLVKQKREP